MNFYKYLKQAREKLNLTQEDAAEKIGVSITTIQNWEKHRLPDKEWWNVIISTYKLNKDEFARYIVNTVSPDEEVEENENEEEKYFPFGWFGDSQKILKKMVLTEEERELLGLKELCTITCDGYSKYLYNFIPPYEYIKKVGSFNILKMQRDLKEKLGGYYDNVVSYLINHPDKNFDIYSLSAKEVFETFPFFSKERIERIERQINYFSNKDKILLAQLEPKNSCYKDSFKFRKTECFDSLCTFKDKYFSGTISLYENSLDYYIEYPSELMQISREENNIYGCLTEEGKKLVQWYKKES